MSQELIARNPDLQRLQDEGYEIELVDGYLIVHHVPYVNDKKLVCYGKLAAPLNLSGEHLLKPSDHIISFSGEYPCYPDGTPIEALKLTQQHSQIGGYDFSYRFSNKPANGYPDYYAKFTRYIEIIADQAASIDEKATARIYKPIVYKENPIFNYEDTNSSRARIGDITRKLAEQRVAIIGLGGTGSYILDMLAKTPVEEIHLFDGDSFCQHNAFRAPGAASIDDLNNQQMKVSYFEKIYSRMHRGIVSHPVFLDEDNLDLLDNMTVVFIAVDSGVVRKMIADYLDERRIFYIDSGIDVSICGDSLLGTARVTCMTENTEHRQFMPTAVDDEQALYASNIQIAELNAFAAITSVFHWKKKLGFYQDVDNSYLSVFDTNDGVIKHEAKEDI